MKHPVRPPVATTPTTCEGPRDRPEQRLPTMVAQADWQTTLAGSGHLQGIA